VDPGASHEEGRNRTAALVFDFDGTLVDSSDIKERAYRAAIGAAVSAPQANVQRAYRAHGTLNRVPQLFNAFRDLVGRVPDDCEVESMVSTYGSFVRERSHEVRLFDGMREFLAAHRPRYYLTVASNAPQDELVAACYASTIDGYFDHIYGYPTTKDEAIEIVQSDCALPRSRIIYIGDRPEDGDIAERMGVPFCRFGPNELEDGNDIVRTISKLAQVVAALASS